MPVMAGQDVCEWGKMSMEPDIIRKVFDLIAFFGVHCNKESRSAMKRILAYIACLAAFGAGPALGWTEPARGSADRAGMLDALRPHAVWALGEPVTFLVGQMRMDGKLGFVTVSPRRPGGGVIDPLTTPMALRDPDGTDLMDGVDMQALLEKSGDTWVAVHWAIGATDVWFIGAELCAAYRAVLTNFCE